MTNALAVQKKILPIWNNVKLQVKISVTFAFITSTTATSSAGGTRFEVYSKYLFWLPHVGHNVCEQAD